VVLKIALLAVLALMLGLTGEARAGGVSFSQNAAAASGKAGAFAGEANDPSAILFNPAGITQLPGTQLLLGTAIVKLDSTFRSSTTTEKTDLQDQFVLAPHIYVTHRFKRWDERVTVGLGIYHPFGLVVDWPDTWQGRFDTTVARLRVTVFNPVIAFQATPKLSVAAGLQVADVAAGFEQLVPEFFPGSGESKVRVHGLTAHPIGWNTGILYHITDTTSAGFMFRSELDAKLQGRADFTGFLHTAGFANTGFRTHAKLPPQAVIGISTKIIPRWTFNADVEWEGWRTIGSLPRDFEGATQSALDSPGIRNWKNSWDFRIGVEYAATDRLALRGGYFYDMTPIPDSTFEPTIPNSNLHAIATGVGYKWERVGFDVAYVIGFYEKRSIDASTKDPNNTLGTTTFGSYSSMAQVFVLSLNFKF
jgi:long-chain fatty acid transport protein